MKPRSKNQSTRLTPSRNSTSARPRSTRRSAASTQSSVAEKSQATDSSLVHDIENEISADQLANFTNEVIETVESHTLTQAELTELIQKHLPDYTDLKSTLEHTREAHKEHLALTKPLTQTAQSIQDDPSITKNRKAEILELAIKAVEKNLQLNHKSKNLHNRLHFLSTAIPAFITNFAIFSGNHYKHLEATTENLKSILRTH